MPNIKSAKKRVRVIEAKTLQNKMAKSQLKTTIKKAQGALAEGNREAASEQTRAAIKSIDRAVSRGLLHRNTAARRKSALAKGLNAVK